MAGKVIVVRKMAFGKWLKSKWDLILNILLLLLTFICIVMVLFGISIIILVVLGIIALGLLFAIVKKLIFGK